jgi:hypothetical protein
VAGFKRSRAFSLPDQSRLPAQSRRNAILRLVSGKLRELLVVTTGVAKNRKPTLLVELRR